MERVKRDASSSGAKGEGVARVVLMSKVVARVMNDFIVNENRVL